MEKAAPKAKPKAKLKAKQTHILMIRDDGKQANVHLSEVDNYKLGGYKEAK